MRFDRFSSAEFIPPIPIPTFDKLFRPVLALAQQQPISRRSAYEAMIKELQLTPDEATARLASGEAIIANRTSWAMTFLTKAGLIVKSAPKTYSITESGRTFLKTHPTVITPKDLEALPGFLASWNDGYGKSTKAAPATQHSTTTEPSPGSSTPQEIIEREVQTLRSDLRSRLIDVILSQTPLFFEQLVLDVLLAMGYGGTREDAAEHLGQSGDEGIDGRINQDTLGLDQILVQAKRYRPDRKIDRKEVQAFIGSLSGQGVTKGVFITTSSFQESAREFVARGLNTKVVLVDGEMLIDLMIRHKIGVRVLKTHEIHEVDQNYFESE